MTHSSRPTLKDIARIAGVDRSTVSRALRHHPLIPISTRKRIEKIARNLNYCPDPMLSALSKYRHQRKTNSIQAILGYLMDVPVKRLQGIFHDIYRGFQNRAAELGYAVDLIHTAEEGMTPRRLTQILQARSITGLMIAPLLRVLQRGKVNLDWKHFASVTMGFSVESPFVHRICDDYPFAMNEAMRQLRARGYHRPAFILKQKHHERNQHYWMSTFLMNQFECIERVRDSILILPESSAVENIYSPEVLAKWWEKLREKPDSLIFVDENAEWLLRKTKLQAPGDVGVVLLAKSEPKSFYSGITVNYYKQGEAAASLLSMLVQCNEIGIPAQPQTIFVPGCWFEGSTLRECTSKSL